MRYWHRRSCSTRWLKVATSSVALDSHSAVAGGGMLVCATSSKGRLPRAFPADCVLEGTFTGAFFVALLPFFVALIFSAGSSSSLELVVKLQLELDGVAAFRFSAFVDFLSFAAFARLASSLSSSASCSILSISFPWIAGEGALDTLDTLPCPGLIFTTNDLDVPHGCASPSTSWSTSNIPICSIISLGVA